MKMYIEHTDTFGGEANYSWVTRLAVKVPDTATDRMLVRRAKAALDMTGVRCRRDDYGDTIVLRPYGCCQVIFLTFD